MLLLIFTGCMYARESSAQLRSGTGKSNITADSGEVHDSLYVKALIIEDRETRVAIVMLDVIAVDVIGDIHHSFLVNIKNRLNNEFRIAHAVIAATHNHLDGFLNGGGKIVDNVEERTILAVEQALKNMETVKVGAGKGYEDRFAMNRRIKLKDGSVFTIRHANPNMPDEEMAEIGGIDTEIGVLKIERMDGTTKAVLFNYACHPYTGVPDKGVTAEFPGFASRTIEENLGHEAMAFFLQGAAGDITEILYKDVNNPRDCEPFGQMLGLSTLKTLGSIRAGKIKHISALTETIDLPLRSDIPDRLDNLAHLEQQLLASLQGTSLNLKTFLPLYMKYALSPDYPSYYAYLYMLEEKTGAKGLKKMDEVNIADMDKYIRNIHVMEKLAQIQEDRYQLLQRKKDIEQFGGKKVQVEVTGIRIGDFILVTFPGEAFAQTGINIKKLSPYPNTIFAGYSNGYIHYAPDPASYSEGGYEVMNCILAPGWYTIYEEEIVNLIRRL